jgi:hypothetical protein
MGVCDIMPTYCSRTFVTWHLKTTYYSLVERALLEIGTHVAHTEQNISGNPFLYLILFLLSTMVRPIIVVKWDKRLICPTGPGLRLG